MDEKQSTHLKEVWVDAVDTNFTVRFDWENDRHHAMKFYPNASVQQTVQTLRDLAYLLEQDEKYGDL